MRTTPRSGHPQFIGPVYTEAQAGEVADRHGWTVRPDGGRWRRVVPRPAGRRIVQLGAIVRLVDAGFIVVCAGGGGVRRRGCTWARPRHRGGDRQDLASSLLARDLGVDVLVLATDVDAVYDGYGQSEQQAIARATPEGLRAHRYAVF